MNNLTRSKIIIYGTLAVIIFFILAIIFYAGGSYNNPSAQGYTFFGNFFSDLGMLKSDNGQNNLKSQIFFILAIFTASFVQIKVFVSLKNQLAKTHRQNLAGFAYKLAAISSIIFLGIAIFPADRLDTLHDWSMLLSFIGIMISLIIFGWQLIKFDLTLKFNGWSFLLTAGTILILLIIAITENLAPTPNRTLTHIIMQKITVIDLLATIFIYGIGLQKTNR